MKIILTSILTVLIAITALGEIPADSVKVYFLAGRRLFDPSLSNNREAMDSFIEKVKEAKALDNIDYLTVRGYASPEGASDANQRLSGLRCDEIAKYISQHGGIDNNQIKTFADGVAWEELRNLVAKHPDMPSQERVLYILDNIPLWIYNRGKTKIIDGKKKQLMDLEGGRVWNWMMVNLFPELRNAVAVALYLKAPSETQISSPDANISTDISISTAIPNSTAIPDEETETVESVVIEESAEPVYTDTIAMNTTNVTSILEGQCESIMAQPKPFYMAVKTNMLLDAVLVPNLAAEFYLGKNISIYGEWMYAWWENNAKHRFWQTYGGDIGLRWWFGKKAHSKPLTGHHLGIYGGILIFDIGYNDTGYMGGKPGGTLWDRFITNSGIEYGYSLPVAKRLNIDFSIGIGYMEGNYIKYFPFDNDYYREQEYKIRYFGPTKAEISLVWLIGRGNTNQRKGGGK